MKLEEGLIRRWEFTFCRQLSLLPSCLPGITWQLTIVPECPIALNSLHNTLDHPPRLANSRARLGIIPHHPRQPPDKPPLTLTVFPLWFGGDRLLGQVVWVVRGWEDGRWSGVGTCLCLFFIRRRDGFRSPSGWKGGPSWARVGGECTEGEGGGAGVG